jgi:hypothetical protein
MVFKLKPPERSSVPSNPLRRSAYYLVTSVNFDMLVTGGQLLTAPISPSSLSLSAAIHYNAAAGRVPGEADALPSDTKSSP